LVSSVQRVLLVGNDAHELRLTHGALSLFGEGISVDVAHDSNIARDYLQRTSRSIDMPRLKLIVLDVKVPRESELNLIRLAKGDEQLRNIPIVVLSASTSTTAIKECYRLGANAFVEKSSSLHRLRESMEILCNFWLHVNRV
jgi:CheY-like chemotaxis protein